MDRRSFIKSLVGISIGSLMGGAFFRFGRGAAPVRYVAAAAREYWYNNPIQDFRDLKADLMHSIAGGAPDEHKPHGSLITVIDSSTRAVKRLFVDVHVHSTIADGDVLYCSCAGGRFFSLDFKTLNLLGVADAPPGWIFGGHLSLVSGSNLVAATLIQDQMGVFDRVGFFDKRSLKFVRHVSSFGFGAHELHVTESGSVFVGHYGSIPGSGAYRAFSSSATYENMPSLKRNDTIDRRGSYPASVTEVDISTGLLLNRLSHIGNPQQSHFIVSAAKEVFIPTNSIKMVSRKDALTHRAFQEGARVEGDYKNFVPASSTYDIKGGGLSLARSEKYRKVIVAGRLNGCAYSLSDGDFPKIEVIDLTPIDPSCGWVNGVAIHPDEDHYLVSTNQGVLAFQLSNHVYSPERSIQVPLKIHSHFMVG